MNITFNPFYIIVVSLITFIFLYKWFNGSRYTTFKKLPPSPPRLPIIGNLYQLGNSIHHSLQNLSQIYGDIMLLHLGSTPTLVISSSKIACEIMKTHDIIFSNRPYSKKAYKLFNNGKDIAFAKYGEYWRQMKSICVLQLLSNHRVRSFRGIREEETLEMVEKIKCTSEHNNNNVVNLSEVFVTFNNDVICRAAFGRKEDVGKRKHMMKLMNEFMMLLGGISLKDFIPWLGWVDKVSGLDEKIDRVSKEFDEFLECVVKEHIDGGGGKNKDESDGKVKGFVDVLLEAQGDGVNGGVALDRQGLKAIILDIFAAGTDTTYTGMEWTMSELLRHPKVMKKLQEEVRNVVKGPNQIINEGDLEKMKYLKAVIKETLRIHPPVPMLLFRESAQDVKINGYDISNKTVVIINAWTIQRDPRVWEDPEVFNPDRFLNSTVDYRGHDFELIPFGAGRRGCPGITFAVASTELVLATLMHRFEWTLPGGAKSECVNMDETNGIVIHRQNPLLAVATPYFCN